MIGLLPIVYCVLLAYWLWRSPWFRLYGLPVWSVSLLFLGKCVLGVLYLYLHQYYYNGGDTMRYILDGKIVYETLFNDPGVYLQLALGPNALEEIPATIAAQVETMGYWNDTSAYTVVRFNALCNLFTFGNEYGNTIIIAFLSTLGLFWLVKAFVQQGQIRSVYLLPAIFLPSFLFWTSGIHKEGLLLTLVGAAMYCLSDVYKKGFRFSNVTGLLVCLVLIFVIRDFIFFLLIPPLVAFIVSRWMQSYTWLVFLLVYAIISIVGLWVPVFDQGNYLHLILAKQNQFMALEAGNSQTSLNDFEPTVLGGLKNLPEALYNTILGPFKIKPAGTLQVISMIDNGIMLVMLVIGAWLLRWKRLAGDPLALFSLFIGLSYLILIGFIVPNMGAISRYRSLAVPLIFLGVYAHISWHSKQD